jgi:CDP-6-deoxy-D-xylo-4-hexulose-3-dehydrase
MVYRIPLAYNSMAQEEINAAIEVMNSGFVTQGQKVQEFEKNLAEMHGVKHAILVNSGSSANLVGIEAIVQLSRLRPDLLNTSILPGDEVVIQGLNWPSTIKPIVNMGLTPVFADVDLLNLNSTVDQIKQAITSKTKMIIAVPVLGNPAFIDELEVYCNSAGLLLFVDGCESFGAQTNNSALIGSIGIATAFSFYFSHHITTIEGGVILTDDDFIADLCFALRAHGWSRNLRLEEFLDIDNSQVDPRFCFVIPGYNVRSTDVNAAIGLEQLKKFDLLLDSRRRLAQGRVSTLSEITQLVRVPGSQQNPGHSWMAFPMLFNSYESKKKVQIELERVGIETRPIIVGNLLRHPLAKNLNLSSSQRNLPFCDEVFNCGIMIGLNPATSQVDEQWLCESLRKVITDFA